MGKTDFIFRKRLGSHRDPSTIMNVVRFSEGLIFFLRFNSVEKNAVVVLQNSRRATFIL